MKPFSESNEKARAESARNPLESRPVMKSLLDEIASFEKSASPQTVTQLFRKSRNLASVDRIPSALVAVKPAAEAIFFERMSQGTPRRSVRNVERFMTSLLFR